MMPERPESPFYVARGRNGYWPIDLYDGTKLVEAWITEGRSYKHAQEIADALCTAYMRGYTHGKEAAEDA